VCGDLDGHPADPDRTGPMLAGTVDPLDHSWRVVGMPYAYRNPVVIVGPPTYNGRDPGVVQLRNIGTTGFEARFAEWEYLDGVHGKKESAAYLVLESGRYTMDDGSVWEVGAFPLSGTQTFTFKRFTAPFGGIPLVLLTAQTAAAEPVAIRARNVKVDGFGVALFEEEALTAGHPTEQIGYLAIYSPPGSGRVTAAGGLTPYMVWKLPVDRRFAPFLGWNVKLDEERSADEEVSHPDETVAALALGGRLFAQAITTADADPFSLRRIDPPATVDVEWGSVPGVDEEWTLVPLAKSFVNPVVIARPASSVDMTPGVVRVRGVSGESFEVRFEEWSYLDGPHSDERVYYLVAEAGQHELGGLTLEAGQLQLADTLGPGGWTQVSLGAAFASTPAVLTAIQTVEEADPVVTRVTQRSSTKFWITMQEEEALADGHAAETAGWIAMEIGSATVEGRRLEVREHAVGNQPVNVSFAFVYDRRFPIMVAEAATTNEEDTCSTRYTSLTPRATTLALQEEQSSDAETSHVLEDTCLFVAE
jgi:hypothetical protein